MQLNFSSALELSVVSMLIVFLTLYGISLVLSSFEKIFKSTKEEVKKVEKKIEQKLENSVVSKVLPKQDITYEQLEQDEDMLVAAIVASMEAAKEHKNSNFRVTRIRQINN